MGEMADYYMEQEMYRDFLSESDDTDSDDDPYYGEDGPPGKINHRDTKEPFPMLKKTSKKTKVVKPVVDTRPKLIHCGNHLIDPNDVVCITKTSKKDLYIVKLRSNPNPEYPIWTNERDIASLVKHFNIITE